MNRLLSNVDYIYPGKQCKENVYAYVHPNPPYNKPLGSHLSASHAGSKPFLHLQGLNPENSRIRG